MSGTIFYCKFLKSCKQQLWNCCYWVQLHFVICACKYRWHDGYFCVWLASCALLLLASIMVLFNQIYILLEKSHAKEWLLFWLLEFWVDWNSFWGNISKSRWYWCQALGLLHLVNMLRIGNYSSVGYLLIVPASVEDLKPVNYMAYNRWIGSKMCILANSLHGFSCWTRAESFSFGTRPLKEARMAMNPEMITTFLY